MRLEHVSEFKYLDVFGRRVACSIRSLVSGKSLQLECARVLHESLLVPSLTYGSEKMVWREMEKSRIRVVQMNNVRGLLGIRRMDGAPNVLGDEGFSPMVRSCGEDRERQDW